MSARRGPALYYRTTAGKVIQVDTEAVGDPRERALYRALADRADTLADKADADDKPKSPTIGFAP